jgi:hypothetical protein
MKYSKGICWIGDCRIPFVDEGDIKSQARAFTEGSSSHKGQAWNNHLGWEGSKGEANPTNTQGRFTPNLLVCDDMLNDGSVSKSGVYDNTKGETNGFHATSRDIVGKRKDIGGFSDKGTNSRYYDLDKWFDKVIDEIQ